MAENRDEIIGTKEAARMVNRSQETVRRWADAGLIPGAKKTFPYGSSSPWQLPRHIIEQIASGEYTPPEN